MSSSVDVGPLLDAQIAATIAALPVQLGGLSAEVLPAVRAGFAAMPKPALSGAVSRSDHDIPGRPGARLRVHRPGDIDGARPCVFWMHGGGLVMGSNDMDDARFDRWCQLFGCIGVSMDYRLAPEHPYPVPLEDCLAGLAWVVEHAADLGVDVSRLGIGGSSAGAGLAAGLAVLARDRGAPAIAFQLLIYPMIDDRMITPSSGWADPVWSPASNAFGWRSYLGPLTGGDVPIYAAAARATDLAGLPSTFIAVGALDGFSDEDIDYAVRLRHAGVPTELHVYAGAPHGFDLMAPDTTVARRARRDMEEWLEAALGQTSS